MLRKILISILVAVAAVCALAFAGCKEWFVREPDPQPNTNIYLIRYFDGVSTRTIEVQNGDLYNLDQIPKKEGYDFLGLFNAEEGGIKFVDANGMCTMPFSGTGNLVLYPQFEVKTYTFEFDYGESEDTAYIITLSYGDKLPDVPAPSPVYGRKFEGWFTQKDGNGTAISADTAVDNANFKLDSDNGKITLYAKYSDMYYSLKQYVDNKLVYECTVKHGSLLADFLVEELPDGRIIAAWSRYENGSPIWETTVEEDLVLYAVKIGYIISFDCNGGSSVDDMIGYGGQRTTVPKPQKQYNEFVGWTYDGIEFYDTFTMPNNNVKLTAVWRRTHYCVTIVSSIDGSIVDEKYVKYGEAYSFNPVIKTGYECLGIFDAAGNLCDGSEVFDADKIFTARLAAKSFEVAYSLQGGVLSSGASGQNVTFDSSYSFPVPSRSGYIFTGYFTSGGLRLTDHKGVGSSKWNIAANTTAYANWITATAKFTETTKKKITDSGTENQYYDTVNLKNLFGCSLEEYLALGCTKITIKIAIDISEIDDGYQAMGISNNHGNWNNTLWQDYNIEHGKSKKDTSKWTHNFTCTLDLRKVNDIVYLIYSAHGSLDDDWYRWGVVLDMTIS